MTTDQASSDSSTPSVLLVSDDTGNLDASWLNANYPTRTPARLLQFQQARTLTQAMTYARSTPTLSAGAKLVKPRYRDRRGFSVPSFDDMAGNPLPRFQYDDTGHVEGLLIEPSSDNSLSYDRAAFSTGAVLTGCVVGGATRLSIDGNILINALVTSQELNTHGVSLAQVEPRTGDMSFSCALYSQTQRYFVISYIRSDNLSLQMVVVDTTALTVKCLVGNCVGQAFVDSYGWVWVKLQLGTFTSLVTGQIAIQCAADANGTVNYSAASVGWFLDAAQLENRAIPTSPMLTSTTGVVYRPAEIVQSPMPLYYPGNWLDSSSTEGSVVIEGRLPTLVPAVGSFAELCRFYLDAQHYLIIGYNSAFQVGLYLYNESSTASLIGVKTGSAEAVFKVGFSYSGNTLTAFAFNGSASLSFGSLGITLPAGILQTLSLSSGNQPILFTKVTGYDQALVVNQLKYLTTLA